MRYLRRFNELLSQEEYFEELVRKFKSAESGSFAFYNDGYSLRLTSDGLIEYCGTLVINEKFRKWWGGEDTGRIPFKIDRIVGGGLILGFGFTTLEGCPSYVGDYFSLMTPNQITDLRGAPQFVGGNFNIRSSKNLRSLEGGPKEVGGNYIVESCGLTSLVGSPEYINGNFFCYGNHLTDLVGAPRYISGSFACQDNKKLTSLRGCPLEIGGMMDLENCPNLWDPSGLRDCRIGIGGLDIDDGKVKFSQIVKLFPTLEDFKNSLDYNYIKGPDTIDLFRFREALDELGIDYVKMNTRKKGGALNSVGNYKFYDETGRQVNFHGELIN